jgi:hypothetical protein
MLRTAFFSRLPGRSNRDKMLTEKHINEMLGALRDATRRIGSKTGNGSE